jgi:hypothetical protein
MDESPAQLADDDGARGCRSPPWRRLQGVSTSPSLALSWLVSLGKSLDSELDRHDGGVLDVVSLLGASCLKTRLGAPLLSSSGARCSPRLIFRGVMHAIASESKAIPSWDQVPPPISSDGASTRRVLWSCCSSEASSVGRDVALLLCL